VVSVAVVVFALLVHLAKTVGLGVVLFEDQVLKELDHILRHVDRLLDHLVHFLM